MKKTGMTMLIYSFAMLLCACASNATGADAPTSDQVSWRGEVSDSEGVSAGICDSLDTSAWMQKDSVSIQILTPEDARVIPEIAEYDYESACEKGEVRQMRGMLPGMGEGIWYTITVDGVEYYYGRYDDSTDQTELFGYAIVSGKYALANGISVGMTKSEVIALCPDMAILDTEGNTLNEVVGHMGWNPAAYPHSPVGMDEKREYVDEKDYYWENQFDYIMIANEEQAPDSLPLYVALMMKNDVVSAITFYYPTAG